MCTAELFRRFAPQKSADTGVGVDKIDENY